MCYCIVLFFQQGDGDEKTEWELLPTYARQVLERELRRATQHYNWLVQEHGKKQQPVQEHGKKQQLAYAQFASSSSSSSGLYSSRTPMAVAPAAAPLSLVTPPTKPGQVPASHMSAPGGSRPYTGTVASQMTPGPLKGARGKLPVARPSQSQSPTTGQTQRSHQTPLAKHEKPVDVNPLATPTSSGDTPVPPPPPPPAQHRTQLTPNKQASAQQQAARVKMEIESSAPHTKNELGSPTFTTSSSSSTTSKEDENPSAVPPPPPPPAAPTSSVARNGAILSPRIGSLTKPKVLHDNVLVCV